MLDKIKTAGRLAAGFLALVAIAIWFKFNPDAREAWDAIFEDDTHD